MRLKVSVVFILLTSWLLTSCQNESQEDFTSLLQVDQNSEVSFDLNVVYGADNRLDWFEATNIWVDRARSTAAHFNSFDLRVNNFDSSQSLRSPTSLGNSRNLCSGESFADQPAEAFCSGFLVGPDLFVTAGHCIRSNSDCSSTKLVFDYAYLNESDDPTVFPADTIYSCKKIIKQELSSSQRLDYALIQLDRPVTGRTPLPFRQVGKAPVGTPLVVIGHPSGLPSKIAGGANVRSTSTYHLTSNLDTFGGNSGSAVFNATTGEVEGILTYGETDYVFRNSCMAVNTCTDSGCSGEDVTIISLITDHIPGDTVNPNTGDVSAWTTSPVLAIPDRDTTGISSSIEVPEAVEGRDVIIEVEIEHTYRGDLQVYIEGPSGLRLQLHDRSGISADNIIGQFGADLKSKDNLFRLNSQPSGEWKLIVKDRAIRDIGTLNRWSVILL